MRRSGVRISSQAPIVALVPQDDCVVRQVLTFGATVRSDELTTHQGGRSLASDLEFESPPRLQSWRSSRKTTAWCDKYSRSVLRSGAMNLRRIKGDDRWLQIWSSNLLPGSNRGARPARRLRGATSTHVRCYGPER